MKRIFRWLACLSLAGAAGCGIFWDDPYVQVTTTPLNWIEIHYYNANREPIRRETVRVNGSGFVEVKSGTSRRVSDSFAKSVGDATWDDYHTQNYHVDPEHVREVFQDLVNAGLFDREKVLRSTKDPSKGRFIAVRAAVDNKTYSEPVNMFEEDPELAEQLYNFVREFRRTRLGRKQPKKAGPPEDEKRPDKKKPDEKKPDEKKPDEKKEGV